jgi:hypothetical protein
MSHPHNCPHCRASLPAPRSRLLGSLVVGLAWTVVMAMVFGALLIGPFIMLIIPFLFAAGVSLITVAHEWAFPDWTCAACGKLIEVPEVTTPEPVRLETAHAA